MTEETQPGTFNKLLPITAMIGSEKSGLLIYGVIVGLNQNPKNPAWTDVNYTGNNFSWSVNTANANYYSYGNSVKTWTYRIGIRTLFNMLAEAHSAGTVADLSYENEAIIEAWISDPAPAEGEKDAVPQPEKRGFLSKIGLG